MKYPVMTPNTRAFFDSEYADLFREWERLAELRESALGSGGGDLADTLYLKIRVCRGKIGELDSILSGAFHLERRRHDAYSNIVWDYVPMEEE